MSTSSAAEQAMPRSNRTRWLALLVLLLGMAIGAAVTGVVATTGGDPPGGTSTAQFSEVQASCRQWMKSSQSDHGPNSDQWCKNMFAWMSDQSGGTMMGSMMWRGPEQMGISCRDWVDQDGAETGLSGQQRCNEMVKWMEGHLSSRGGNWMMQDR